MRRDEKKERLTVDCETLLDCCGELLGQLLADEVVVLTTSGASVAVVRQVGRLTSSRDAYLSSFWIE